MIAQLNEERTQISFLVQNLVRDVAPDITSSSWRPSAFMRPVLPKMASLGLLGFFIPPEMGGRGDDLLALGEACAECEHLLPPLREVLTAHSAMFCQPLHRYGSPAQQRNFLPKCADGTIVGTAAIAVPQEGIELPPMPIEAVPAHRDGMAGYELNGQFADLPLGSLATHFLIFAVNPHDQGISAFILSRHAPGVYMAPAKGKPEDLAADMALEKAWVPANARVGAEGKGAHIVEDAIAYARFTLVAGAIGRLKRYLSHALSCMAGDTLAPEKKSAEALIVVRMFQRLDRLNEHLAQLTAQFAREENIAYSAALAGWFARMATSDSAADMANLEIMCPMHDPEGTLGSPFSYAR